MAVLFVLVVLFGLKSMHSRSYRGPRRTRAMLKNNLRVGGRIYVTIALGDAATSCFFSLQEPRTCTPLTCESGGRLAVKNIVRRDSFGWEARQPTPFVLSEIERFPTARGEIGPRAKILDRHRDR